MAHVPQSTTAWWTYFVGAASRVPDAAPDAALLSCCGLVPYSCSSSSCSSFWTDTAGPAKEGVRSCEGLHKGSGQGHTRQPEAAWQRLLKHHAPAVPVRRRIQSCSIRLSYNKQQCKLGALVARCSGSWCGWRTAALTKVMQRARQVGGGMRLQHQRHLPPHQP